MTYYERPFIKITWNEADEYVEVEWLAFACGEPYREAINKALELHRLKGCPRSLTDMRKASVIDEEDAKWIGEVWIPRARAAGLCRIAVIAPASAVPEMQIHQLSQKKGGQKHAAQIGVRVEYFRNYEAARRWLLEREGGPARR